MRRLLFALAFALCALPMSGSARRRAVVVPVSWDAALVVEPRAMQTIGALQIASSSTLAARWNAPAIPVDHYVLTASETAGGSPLQFATTATSLTLTALESATEYRVSIVACRDAACAAPVTANAQATATTAEEYWRVRGTGRSYATADRIVSDGNTKAYALAWGSEAGAALAGRAQLYYDPSGGSEKGVKIGAMSGTITTSADSVASYSGVSGFGFHRSDAQGHPGTGPSTFQPIALSPRMGGKVRLFYEATDADGRGRVYSIDSVDGWTGRDFNTTAATICQDSDVVPVGACPPTLLIGVEGDGNPKVREARQLKVGIPTLSGWTWDGEPGTFMVVTLHLTDATCSSTFFNLGYAVWDGSRWALQYGANGCPKLIPGVQAPMPVHIGGARYKLYFNHNTTSGGGPDTFKPMKVLYADGAAIGQASTVEFEEWETIDRARRVHYLWPDGTLMTDTEKSMLDDYHVWMPSNDLSLQVIYSNMSCPANACGPPFVGMAVLLNP
jgi:hypothetical protein